MAIELSVYVTAKTESGRSNCLPSRRPIRRLKNGKPGVVFRGRVFAAYAAKAEKAQPHVYIRLHDPDFPIAECPLWEEGDEPVFPNLPTPSRKDEVGTTPVPQVSASFNRETLLDALIKLGGKLEDAKLELDFHKKSTASIRGEMRELKAALDESEARRKELSRRAAELAGYKMRCEREIEENERLRDELSRRNSDPEFARTIGHLENVITDLTDQLGVVTKERNDFEKSADELSRQIEGYEDWIKSLTDEIESLRRT